MNRIQYARLATAAIALLVGLSMSACAAPPSPTAAPPAIAPAASATSPASTVPATTQPTTAGAGPTAQATSGAAATTAPTSSAATTSQAAGGTLQIGLDVDAGTGDPRLMQDTSAYRLRELVFDGLVYIKPDYTPAPDLADSWETPNDTTWIFHLHKGVKFHNGQDFTANDVKYTFDTILDTKFASPLRSFYTPIKSIDVIDPYTVQFTTTDPYGPFLSYMNAGIVPQAAASQDPTGFANNPIGTGPFKFVSWKRGDTITLAANPNYFQGPPKLAGIQLKIVPNNSARAVALESGGLDFIQSPLSPQDVARLKTESKFTVEQTPAAGYTYINLNCADPILSDVKVRQALSYLVDRAGIIKSIYQGIGQLATGPIPPGMWAYSNDLPSYDYNVNQAKTLLDQDGWTVGSNGIRQKNGQPLKITVETHTEDPDRAQVIQVLQAQFQQVGIQADTKVEAFASLLPDLQAGNFQFVVIGWLNLANPDQAMFRQFTINGSANYGKCNDPQLSQLVTQARATLDQTKAKALYDQASKLVVQDAFYIFIEYQEYIAIHRADLHGFVINPVQYFYSMRNVTIGP